MTAEERDLRSRFRGPGILAMIGREDGVHLPLQQFSKSRDIKSMPRRAVGPEIFLRQSKQTHRRIHPPPVLWVGRPRVLLLQMHETTRGLDQPLEIIRVVRFRAATRDARGRRALRSSAAHSNSEKSPRSRDAPRFRRSFVPAVCRSVARRAGKFFGLCSRRA